MGSLPKGARAARATAAAGSGRHLLQLQHLPLPTGAATVQAKMQQQQLLLPLGGVDASCAAPVKAESTEVASAAGGRLGVDRRHLKKLEKTIVAQNRLPQA